MKTLLTNLSRLVLVLVLVCGGLGSADANDFGVNDVSEKLEKVDGSVRQVKAWEALFDSPLLRKIPANLNAVNAFEIMVPGSLARIKSAMGSLASNSQQAFVNGLKSCADNSALAQSLTRVKLPTVDDVLSATNKIKQHRVDVGVPSNKNFGYLEGNLSGGSVSNLPGTVVSSGPAVPVNQQIFDAIEVGGWSRFTDSEYKMLNQLARDLGATPGGSNVNSAINGSLKIVSERAYCASCQGVIQQFNQLFPNIEIKLVDGVR